MPAHLHGTFSIFQRASTLARALLGSRDRVVLSLWRPRLFDFDPSQFDLVTYHATDLYTTHHLSRNVEKEFMAEVALSFASSQALLEKLQTVTPRSFLLQNEVDFELLSTPATEPAELAAIPKPRLIYSGVIKEQIRLGLLADIAKRLADCSLVLVGPVGNLGDQGAQYDQLRGLPKVYKLGPKSVEGLPGYLQHGDVSLMPYVVGEYTRHISPLKFHEYYTAGMPTVGSAIEPLQPHADLVRLADDLEDWIRAIRFLLSAKTTPRDVAKRREAAREFDWDRLARRYLEQLAAALGS